MCSSAHAHSHASPLVGKAESRTCNEINNVTSTQMQPTATNGIRFPFLVRCIWCFVPSIVVTVWLCNVRATARRSSAMWMKLFRPKVNLLLLIRMYFSFLFFHFSRSSFCSFGDDGKLAACVSVSVCRVRSVCVAQDSFWFLYNCCCRIQSSSSMWLN